MLEVNDIWYDQSVGTLYMFWVINFSFIICFMIWTPINFAIILNRLWQKWDKSHFLSLLRVSKTDIKMSLMNCFCSSVQWAEIGLFSCQSTVQLEAENFLSLKLIEKESFQQATWPLQKQLGAPCWLFLGLFLVEVIFFYLLAFTNLAH